MMLVGNEAHSSSRHAIKTMKISEIQDVARKYTTTFARIKSGTFSGKPFMKSGESRMVNHE